jgi:SagB-type dehydrogenase family enzyme
VPEPGGVARRYHERTNHSSESIRRAGPPPDPATRPDPFKRYCGGDVVALPERLPERTTPALEALAGAGPPQRAALDLAELARLLRLGAGVHRTRTLAPGDTYHFRTYSSAGGLYPLELYVAAAELADLPAGLYHFDPRAAALRRLRTGDPRPALAAAADEPQLAGAGAVLALTGLLWRSAWKYGERGLRHLFWDGGTMLAGLLALAASAGLEPRLLSAFCDAHARTLLGVDGMREAPLALLAVGRAPPAGSALGPIAAEAAEVASPSFALADELLAASSLADGEAVRGWRAAAAAIGADEAAPARTAGAMAPQTAAGSGEHARAQGTARRHGAADAPLSRDPTERVIRRRGSARAFARAPIGIEELRVALDRALAPIPGDLPALTELRLLAAAVSGLEQGAYRFAGGRFELLGRGDFRRTAGYLCLEQALGARAAATHFLLADLERALERLGARGYRAVQLEAGVRAGRIYLAAYAQCLGATGLTFYDRDVSTFLAPGLEPLMCVAVGLDGRRRKLAERRQALLRGRG